MNTKNLGDRVKEFYHRHKPLIEDLRPENIWNNIINFYQEHKNPIVIGVTALGILLGTSIDSKAQTPGEIDQQVAQEYGINPAYFNTDITVVTTSGNQYTIPMAVVTTNDTVSGGDMSGYAILENINPTQENVLLDSVPNSCFSVISIANFDPETYAQDARDHWDNCGYFVTSTKKINSHGIDGVFDFSPNPTTSKNNHEITIKSNEHITSYSIFDIQGRQVGKGTPNYNPDKTFILGLDNLSNGMYFINVETENGKTETEKVMRL